MSYKVSVIIPVYNSEKYIEKCLGSLLNQTLKEVEIICVNDGSTDKSLEILNKCKDSNSNIKVINQKNTGPSIARNNGLNLASGEYVAFVDSDDWVEQNMYYNLYNVAIRYHLNMVMCHCINDYNNGLVSKQTYLDLPANKILTKKDIKEYIYPGCMGNSIYSSLWNKIISRKYLNSLNLMTDTDLKYGEDLIYQLEIYDGLDRLYYVNKPYYHYNHINKFSLTKCKSKDYFTSVIVKNYRLRKPYAERWEVLDYLNNYFVCYSLMEFASEVKDRTENILILFKKYLKQNDFYSAVRSIDYFSKGFKKCRYSIKIKMLLVSFKLIMNIIT
jgi:Glycosyltransferases involved in cell wall biogenesis